ncbi:XRE family transcriptional regulator [Wenyingzhuangia sp. IMCC45574]
MLKIKELRERKNLTQNEISEQTGINKRTFINYEQGNTDIPFNKLQKIATVLKVNILELIGEEVPDTNNNKIPFYENVETIGGTQESTYNDHSQAITSALTVDAGDWFKDATAAIRHYGDSMSEYISGCVLVIKKINNINEIIWGRNYVVETRERRITKRVAEFDPEHIICYSTNEERYPDDRLVHQPIVINKKDIISIHIVLGSVNKEESTGRVSVL